MVHSDTRLEYSILDKSSRWRGRHGHTLTSVDWHPPACVHGPLLGAGRTMGIYFLGYWHLVLGRGYGRDLTGHITWLTGAPGSVVFYVVGAVLLLLPEDWWTSGRVQKRIRSGLGVFWLTVAIAQAWPAAGFWQGSKLSQIFAAAAGMPQPFYVADPIAVMETAASLNPAIWNAVFVTIMLGLGVLYLSNVPSRFVAGLTLSWLLFSWWMGQDFGVMGGIGTDPNSSPVMALLLLATWQMRWKRTTTPLTPSK